MFYIVKNFFFCMFYFVVLPFQVRVTPGCKFLSLLTGTGRSLCNENEVADHHKTTQTQLPGVKGKGKGGEGGEREKRKSKLYSIRYKNECSTMLRIKGDTVERYPIHTPIVQPSMTPPAKFRRKPGSSYHAVWNHSLVYNLDISEILQPHALILFEFLDYGSKFERGVREYDSFHVSIT